jgi:coatomer subunit gamma
LPDSDEGYDDEYMLEDFEISVADQIQKTKLNNFAVAWDAADTEGNLFIYLFIFKINNV